MARCLRFWRVIVVLCCIYVRILDASSSSESRNATSIDKHRKTPTRVTGYGSRSPHRPVKESPRARVVVKETDNGLLIRVSNTTLQITSGVDGAMALSIVNETVDDGQRFEGLYGVYNVPEGQLWVWVAESDTVYEAPLLNGQSWWSISRIHRLHAQLVRSSFSVDLSRAQRLEQQRQVALLRYALKHHEWYTANGTMVQDLTRNLQASFDTMGRRSAQQWWHSNLTRPDSRFFWNEVPLEPLICANSTEADLLLAHAQPITSAFVGRQTVEVANATYDELLVTRRSRFRAGTRFTRRGADHTGAVANYAETEQMVLRAAGDELVEVSSFTQTRGSIPLRWSSPADIKTYRPRVRIGTDPIAQARAVRLHLLDQVQRYIESPGTSPSLVFCNLVDKKSDQGRLGRAFDAVLRAVLEVYDGDVVNASSIEHIWYDFHAEVKHGRWERLQTLLEAVKGALAEHGYFAAKAVNGTLVVDRRQSGVVRTNCMDCLDRTNVVQSLFGRFVLFAQLSETRIVPTPYKRAFRLHPMTLPWPEGESAHRLLWADNADAISRLYAGTPALKGDFTRTGKRTKKGALDDGMNSLQRYYLNNFLDADRQEGMDLMVGLQPFTSLGEDEEEEMPATPRSNLSFRGLSLQEAARRALLGPFAELKEAEHARIKLHETVGGAMRRPRPLLELRWLPGDLQTQVQSVASFSDELPDLLSTQGSLQALDERAASDLPWWAVFAESSDDDDDRRIASALGRVETSAINNGGYLLGAMIVGTRSPLGMAALVITLMGLSTVGGDEILSKL